MAPRPSWPARRSSAPPTRRPRSGRCAPPRRPRNAMDVVDALAARGRFFRVLQQTERSQTAVMTIAPGEDGGPSPLVGYTDNMRVLGVIIGLLLAVGALSPAAAQTTGLSTPNPQAPVFVVRPN